jgi:diguanylate cyclase (GGDEF)-like protein/PAS domain S-box-containing protein
MGPRHGDDEVSTSEVVPAVLVEALLRLCQGEFSHRLPRTMARDEPDTIAFFFNAIAEELERIVESSREQEKRLETTVEALSEALTRVAAGEFADVEVARDFRGDPLDVLVYLVNNTVGELSILLAEKERRAEADRTRLERLVVEGTKRLDESEENFQRLFETAPQPLVLFDVTTLVVRRSNQRAANLFEAPVNGLIGRHLADFFEDPADKQALVERITAEQSVENLAMRLKCVGDRPFWALVNASIVRTTDGHACVAGFADLTAQKAIEEQLRAAATTDSLTGTLTRRRLFELAESEWGRAERYGRPICVALLDLDHFKSVNDRFGHLVGDEALRKTGAALRTTLRREDWAGRYGGEEFVVLLPETRIDAARDAVERLRVCVEAIVLETDGTRVPLTLSAGVATMRAGESFEDVLARADEALYRAKADGRNRVVTAS